MTPPLPLGKKVRLPLDPEPWEIAAVEWDGIERTYCLTQGENVCRLSARALEPMLRRVHG